MSHESHLEEFTDIAMQEKAYGIVTQQVIEASE
jgi:DNA-directed RNA polymerase subunit K/omega